MSVEVELNANDYNTILDWFIKAFGKNNNGKEQDKKTYQKVAVMAQQYLDDEQWMKEFGKD